MSNLVRQAPSSTANRTTSPPLSEGLRRLLSSGDASRQVEAIASSPALLSEATASLPALRIHATAPAGPEGVQRVVKPRFATFPQPERSDGEWAAFWRDWHIACAALTEEALEAGMTAWLRRSPAEKFLPKPGELREMASQAPTRAAEMHRRARAAAELAQERQRKPVERVEPEAVKAVMAGFYAGSLARKVTDRVPVASVLDGDPADHDARVQAEHAQIEATMEWAAALAEAQQRSGALTDRSASVEQVVAATQAQKRAADAIRKVADARDARLKANHPHSAAHDQAA